VSVMPLTLLLVATVLLVQQQSISYGSGTAPSFT
jgi:hypothetical protein